MSTAAVTTKSGKPVVHGRLMTIDGFSLVGDPFTGFPTSRPTSP